MQSLSLMIALNMVPKLKVFVEDVGGVFFFFLERERELVRPALHVLFVVGHHVGERCDE